MTLSKVKAYTNRASYGWGGTAKIIRYMSSRNFFLKYTEEPEIMIWLKNNGHFQYDRLTELIKSFELYCGVESTS